MLRQYGSNLSASAFDSSVTIIIRMRRFRSRPAVAVAVLVLGVVSLVLIAYTNRSGISKHPVVAARLVASTPPLVLPIPVEGVRPHQLVNSWGSPRSEGRKHEGIDIFAPRGEPIRSTTSGIVVTLATRRRGGNVVRVLGPGGQWHYYAHLERFSEIRVGQVIVRGTIIGYVGDSGNAKGTPPHLHYGIYHFAGGAINPYSLLTAKTNGRGA